MSARSIDFVVIALADGSHGVTPPPVERCYFIAVHRASIDAFNKLDVKDGDVYGA
jgi:hypothetical protein